MFENYGKDKQRFIAKGEYSDDTIDRVVKFENIINNELGNNKHRRIHGIFSLLFDIARAESGVSMFLGNELGGRQRENDKYNGENIQRPDSYNAEDSINTNKELQVKSLDSNESKNSTELFRIEETYSGGQRLDIDVDTNGEGYRVEGLNGAYQNKDMLLDAFRDRHPEYFAELDGDASVNNKGTDTFIKTVLVNSLHHSSFSPAFRQRMTAELNAA